MNLLALIIQIFTTIFGVCVGLVVIVVCALSLICLLPIYIFRWVLCHAAKYVRPDLANIVTARGQFLASENFTSGKPPRATIVSTCVLRGHQTLENAKVTLQSRMLCEKTENNSLKYPEMTQYITSWLGFKFWKEENVFNIDDHVMSFKAIDSVYFTSSHLQQFTEYLLNKPYEPEKSPWEIFIINNYIDEAVTSEEMTLIVARTHHSLTDGFGKVFSFVSGIGKGPITLPSPEPKHPSKTIFQNIALQILFPFRVIYDFSRVVFVTFKNHPWKIPDSKKSWKQLYNCTNKIPIEKLKTIKNSFGVSFSSVVQAACTAAVRQNLIRKYKKTREMDNVPSILIMPLPNHPKTLQNYCTGAYLSLPIKSDDPVIRLKTCENELTIAKTSAMPFLGKYLPVIVGSLTANFVALFGKNRSFPIGISLFPVSCSKFSMLDKDVVEVFTTSGAQSGVTGFNFLISSYMDGIKFAAVGENALFSDQDIKDILNAICTEIDVLYKLGKEHVQFSYISTNTNFMQST